jgi:hypothetical protein
MRRALQEQHLVGHSEAGCPSSLIAIMKIEKYLGSA